MVRFCGTGFLINHGMRSSRPLAAALVARQTQIIKARAMDLGACVQTSHTPPHFHRSDAAF